MTEWMKMTDEIGPEKIVHLYDPATGMKGVVVIDTAFFGRAAGGTRLLPNITTEEIFWLARAMTYKFNTLELQIGGAKAGIWADPAINGGGREATLRAFGRVAKPLLATELALGVDMGTTSQDIKLIYQGAELPPPGTGLTQQEKDGTPLEDHATGYGVVVAAKASCEFAGGKLSGATVAIEGFGKVGGGVASYMAAEGARVVAISTIKGTTYNENGLDVKRLLEKRRKTGDRAIEEYQDAQHLDRAALYSLPVDILIPGARPHVIDKNNVGSIQAKIISSIANVPITEEAEETLFQRGIISVPDFISNAGGVVLGTTDRIGGTAEQVFLGIRTLIRPITIEILDDARRKGANPHSLAVNRARERIIRARKGENPDQIAGNKWQFLGNINRDNA